MKIIDFCKKNEANLNALMKQGLSISKILTFARFYNEFYSYDKTVPKMDRYKAIAKKNKVSLRYVLIGIKKVERVI
jgi:hypothetical protein